MGDKGKEGGRREAENERKEGNGVKLYRRRQLFRSRHSVGAQLENVGGPTEKDSKRESEIERERERARDREGPVGTATRGFVGHRRRRRKWGATRRVAFEVKTQAVSYTHLTLPTILLV